jgi:DNA polymerase-3 subunit epsilon
MTAANAGPPASLPAGAVCADVTPPGWRPDATGGGPAARRVVALDTETTGLDPSSCRVVEVAAVEFDPTAPRLLRGSPGVRRVFATLVDPGGPVAASDIHGITDADVAGAPTFADCWPALACLLADAVVVGHNVAFDWAFLAAEASRVGGVLPAVTLVDTKALARRWWPDAPSYRLVHCAPRVGVDVSSAHSAVDDALACAELLLALPDPEVAAACADGRFPARCDGVVFPPLAPRRRPPPHDPASAAAPAAPGVS